MIWSAKTCGDDIIPSFLRVFIKMSTVQLFSYLKVLEKMVCRSIAPDL